MLFIFYYRLKIEKRLKVSEPATHTHTHHHHMSNCLILKLLTALQAISVLEAGTAHVELHYRAVSGGHS